MPTPRLPRILSVLCYAVRDGHVLMMHRRKQPNLGLWTAPGGKLEWDEAPHATVVREMHEETGLTVVNPALHAVITEVSPSEDYQWMMFVYVAHAFAGEVGETHEGDLAWIPIADLPDLPTPEADRIFGPLVLADDGHVHELKFSYDEQIRLTRWEEAGAASKPNG